MQVRYAPMPIIDLEYDDELLNARAYYKDCDAVIELAGVTIKTASQAFAPGPGEMVTMLRRLAAELAASWREQWSVEAESTEINNYVESVRHSDRELDEASGF